MKDGELDFALLAQIGRHFVSDDPADLAWSNRH